MPVVASLNRLLKIVPQSALGVMTLEPLLNNVGARLRQQVIEVANVPLKSVNVYVTGETSSPTVIMEASNDQVEWVEVATITGDGRLINNEAWAYMRLSVTTYVDGEIGGAFHGTA